MTFETSTVLLFRGSAMILLIFGGLASLACGITVYLKNLGRDPDHLDIEIGGCKVKARTVGAVLMGTACFWAWAGVWARPSYETSADGTHRVSAAGYELVATPVATRPVACLASAIRDPGVLQGLFREAIEEHKSDPDSVLKLNGQPAHYDLNSVEVSVADDGMYLLKTRVKSADSVGTVYFAADSSNGKIIFRPWQVTGAVSRDNNPNRVDLPNGEVHAPNAKPLPFRDEKNRMRY